VLAGVLAVPAAASADREFWVSTHGSDADQGTRAAPFATLGKAQQAVRRALREGPKTDIQVIVRGGTYRLTQPLELDSRDSGHGGQTVTWRASGNQKPVVSGAERVPGSAWSRWDADADIWRARVGKVATRELYVDGERRTRAATTDYPAGFLPSWNDGGPDSGIEYLPTIEPTGLNPGTWGDPTTWTNVSDIEALILTQWKAMSVPLRSVTPADGSTPGLLGMAEPGWTNANVFREADTGQPGIWSFWQVTRFENALQFLDEPGEWYLDRRSGWLYYEPEPGEKLKDARVELPVLESLLELNGKKDKPVSDLRFRGLTFSYATWLDPSSGDGYVSDQAGFHLTGTGHQPNTIGHDPHDTATPGNVSARFDHDVRFLDDRFRHLGAVGLSLGTGSQDTQVRGNRFIDIGSSAVQLSGISRADHHPQSRAQMSLSNAIERNRISHVGWEYPDAPGIFAGFAADTRIAHNLVQDVPWSGIALGWGWGLLDPGGFPGLPGAGQYQWGQWDTPTPNRDSVIAHNTIRDFLGLLWDGGAVYTTGAQGTSAANGLRIADNAAYGKRPAAGGNTFYTDGGTRYVTVRGNTSYGNPIGSVTFGPPPHAGDPLPYDSEPSDANGLPYGSEIGGCRTYGDISYVNNSWFEAPMQSVIEQSNDAYEPITGDRPWSSEGFFDVCPYSDQGVSYPTGLSYSGNVIYPARP
jgi:hypothetical protein